MLAALLLLTCCIERFSPSVWDGALSRSAASVFRFCFFCCRAAALTRRRLGLRISDQRVFHQAVGSPRIRRSSAVPCFPLPDGYARSFCVGGLRHSRSPPHFPALASCAWNASRAFAVWLGWCRPMAPANSFPFAMSHHAHVLGSAAGFPGIRRSFAVPWVSGSPGGPFWCTDKGWLLSVVLRFSPVLR